MKKSTRGRWWLEVGVARERWLWAARGLVMKQCVNFCVGGWVRWARGRRRQWCLVHRELDEWMNSVRGGVDLVRPVFPYETDTCFCVCNAKTRACAGLKSGGN